MGRSFHGVGMLDAQRGFIDQLVDFVRERSVDVVLIAGDVYDRALPGLDVVKLLDDALVGITGAGAKVVLTSGNHDSAIRLGFASRLLERGGVHLRTRVEDLDFPVLFSLEGNDARLSTATDAAGTEETGPLLAIYGIPYLEPRLVAGKLDAAANHFDVTQAAVQRIRQDLAARNNSAPVHAVVLAHTFASGGITSDSERELSIGGLGAVPLDLFEGFAYAALGHLHGRQELAPNVRYSGSPLAYSFSEAKHRKGAWLLDVGPDGATEVSEVLWRAPRELAVLRGRLVELLESPDHAWAESAYCQVTLTDPMRPPQAMEQLRTRFPDTLVLGFDPEGSADKGKTSYSSRLAEAQDDLGVCCGFLDHVRGRPADGLETAALQEALEAVRLEGAGL